MQGANSLVIDRSSGIKLFIYRDGDIIKFKWSHSDSASFGMNFDEMNKLILYLQSIKGAIADEKPKDK